MEILNFNYQRHTPGRQTDLNSTPQWHITLCAIAAGLLHEYLGCDLG